MGKMYFPGLVNAGFQIISLSNSTAVGINSTVRDAGAQVLYISAETQNARFRSDGTDPTLTTGVLLEKDKLHRIEGFDGTSILKFQRSTGVCTLHIQGMKYVGSGSR